MASFGFYFTHFYSIYAIASCFYWLYDFFSVFSPTRNELPRHTTQPEKLFNIQEAFARNIDWHFVCMLKQEEKTGKKKDEIV